MACSICGNMGNVVYKEKKLCKDCFSRIIEKRIRKNARINRLFSKGDRILVIGELNEYIVKEIIKELPANIFKRKTVDKGFVSKNKINKIVINWTMDDEIVYFLKNFFSGKKGKIDKKIVKLLRVVGDDELKIFSEIKGVKFAPNEKDKELSKVLEYMTEKYPDTKEKLLNSAISFEKIRGLE